MLSSLHVPIALGIGLIIAATVAAWALFRLAALNRAAHRREEEVQIRLDMTNRLFGGTEIDQVLPVAVDALDDVFGFSSCTITADEHIAHIGKVGETPNVCVEAPGVMLLAHAHDELSAGDEALLDALMAGLATAVDRLRLEDEVREARVVAAIGKQRAGFLSAVSHNLRTPLTAIKAASTTLQAGWSRIEPEERRELLETISDESERLERLVRNTLELSRIRAGALDVHAEPVDIADLVQHAVRRLRPISRAHRVRLVVADDLPAVELDITMIEQILLNLLENALRFAPPGSEIVISAQAPDPDHVEIRIADHGPGVPADAHERIFEEFTGADPTKTSTGLGLTIVRALVLAQHGRVHYEDTPGGGATFVCTFLREARHS